MEIVVLDHFKFASARYRSEGPHSGEAFREDILLPALKASNAISIDLDNNFGFPASWLEECFGGLVRGGLSSDEVLNRINFLSEDSLLVAEIIQIIKDANQADV